MADKKVKKKDEMAPLSPEEEKVIAKISGAMPTEENLLEGMAKISGETDTPFTDGLKKSLEKEAKKKAIIDKASEIEDYHVAGGKLKKAHQQQHEENMSKVIENASEVEIDELKDKFVNEEIDKLEIDVSLETGKKSVTVIENASEVLVEGTKVNQLGADMVKLAGIDSRLNEIKTEQKTIQTIIDEYLKTQGLFLPFEKLKTESTSLRKDYGLLKTDIGKRALDNYEKTGEKKPALGCVIKMFKNREFSVDVNKAVQWCIDKDLKVFLAIDKEKYPEQLALGTFPDMPGKVDDSKIPKASISIKPYQKKTDE